MIVTNPDGSQKETEMENLFSMAGINFKNIKENEDKLVKTLKNYIFNLMMIGKKNLVLILHM